MATALKPERQKSIASEVQDKGQVIVSELSRRFDVSKVTIRRDLRELDQGGLLHRVHGGAVAIEPSLDESPVMRRMRQAAECKKQIGRAAAKLVSDGDSVFFGSGSTTLYVVQYLLDRKDLTVVTNALTIATELADAKGITTVVTGGFMRGSELSLVGHIAEQALREVRVDKVIIGIPAIAVEAGMTNDYLPEVMTDRAIIEMTTELIVVADHTKFGQVGSAYLAPVERISTLVTDSGICKDMLTRLEDRGVRVLVADSD